jgi:predicted O-methyltransferase YrrM
MTKELEYIIEKYKPDLTQRLPITLPWTRIELALLFAELDYKIGAEIGVAQGYYSEELCKANPSMKLFSIDPWKAYKGTGQRKASRFYKDAVERLEPYNCVIMRDFSMNAVKAFDDGELDFVYIDGNHDFKNVACDICEWSKVVRPGGIIAGHDFKRTKGKNYILHVKDVVQAYAYAHQIRPWFVLNSDRNPNWMWVKDNAD